MPHDLPREGANAFLACLGNAFDRLPETVRRAHVGKIRLNGHARVMRGGAFACALANIMGLPAASDRTEMTSRAITFPIA